MRNPPSDDESWSAQEPDAVEEEVSEASEALSVETSPEVALELGIAVAVSVALDVGSTVVSAAIVSDGAVVSDASEVVRLLDSVGQAEKTVSAAFQIVVTLDESVV